MSNEENLAISRAGLERQTLTGQVAVVTGAGRGIGREIARAFAWLGARVVIAELSEQGLETERLVKEAGGEALFVQTDVSDEDSVARLAQTTHQAYGPVSILVNNAILCPAARVQDMEVSLWDRVIAVNLRGTFLTCKTFLPDMLSPSSPPPVIVNMVSTDAMPGLSAYIASKQGITGFSQSLAAEVGQAGVRVIAFAPGMVDTPGIRGVAQGLAPNLGLTPDQFLNLSLHPAYAGLMPAGDAAAATAYLVARLADEYHGEVVNGYTLLERAGLIETLQVAVPAGVPEPQPTALQAPSQALQQAIALSLKLQEMIEQTESEFNQLPVFVRPMARGGFKSKAGHSLQDWKRTAASLAGQLEAVQAGNPAPAATLRSNLPALEASFDKLVQYYQDVPAETARFTRDKELLCEVSRISAERVTSIRLLVEALQVL